MLLRVTVLACVFIYATAGAVSAQETLMVNLAELTPGASTTRTVDPGTYRVRVISLLPNTEKYRYDVSVQRVFRPHAEIPLPDVPRYLATAQEPAECITLSNAAVTLLTATDERQVPTLVGDLRRALFEGRNCSETLKRSAERVNSLTFQTPEESFQLRRQEDLVVTVRRTTEGEGSVLTWTKVFSTGSGGEWRPTYGLAFVNSNARLYHTVASTTAGQFTVQEQHDRRDWDYVPSVIFAYFPNKEQALSASPSLGLGYHREKPAVLGGILFSYRENIGLSLGAAYLSQPDLIGTYEVGSIVQQNLTESQLHEDQYRLTWFVSLTLRSLTAPFQTRQVSPATTNP